MGKNLKYVIRFLAIVLFQVLLLKRIDLSYQNFNYIHIFIYPLFLLLLPFQWSKFLYLIIAFVLGISVDLFYNSLGVHAFASVFIAFLRPYILRLIEPREGYNKDSTPTLFKMGFAWLFIYTSILIFIHHLIYFSMEVFSPQYPFEIILRTIFSFIVSLTTIMLVHFIFRPKS